MEMETYMKTIVMLVVLMKFAFSKITLALHNTDCPGYVRWLCEII